jgi:hypothetical protein
MKRWAEAYRHTNPTLEELATFDRAHRVAIFNAVTPEVRAALWQAQLNRFAQRSDLTATQRALIAEGATLMTPALYNREPAASAAFKSFWSRAEPEFTSPATKRTWFDLGSVVVEPDNASPSDGSRLQPANALFSNCTCSTSASGECGSKSCLAASCTQWAGCGAGGNLICNGTCQ